MMMIRPLLLILCTFGLSEGKLSGPCRRRGTSYGWLCVCDEGGCDALPDSIPGEGEIIVTTSSKSRGPFQPSKLKWRTAAKGTEIRLVLDPRLRLQEIIGFGGAFTDAAGGNIRRLPSALQSDLLASYYDQEKGAAYTLGRVPMASCDFSTHEYSYDDVSGDLSLANFSLAPEDKELKIPYLLQAKRLSPSLRLFGSPWSAPGWMKTSGKMSGKGALKGQPGGEYYRAWAKYFVKFLDAYARAGVPLWAVTVQNEPSTGFIPNYAFQAMAMSAGTERDFVKLDLGPALTASAHNATAVIILDDQRIYAPQFAATIMSDPDAAKFVSGLGLHWYMDFVTPASVLDTVHKAHPNLFLLSTEACTGSLPWEKRGVTLGSWKRGSQYASDILSDLNHWTSGWVDWNLALNSSGGPNWVDNNVDAPVIVPDNFSKMPPTFYKQPMFYALAHFRLLGF